MGAEAFGVMLTVLQHYNQGKLNDAVEAMESEARMSGMSAIVAAELPIIFQGAVFVALGAGYLEAREAAKNEFSRTGFSQGFVMGILGWQWQHVVKRFYLQHIVHIYHFDEEINTIRVESYNLGLKGGFLLGSNLSPRLRKAYSRGLRKLAGHPSTGDWTASDQVSFVISLAGALVRSGRLAFS